MQVVTRSRVALAYKECGIAERGSLLFVHGWGGDHTMFAAQQAAFAGSHRTVSVDLRGYGASDAPQQEYTVAGYRDDLAWLCRELGLRWPLVVGHSMGGAVALELAAAHPHMVRGVMLIDTVLFPPDALLAVIRRAADGIGGPDHHAVVAETAAALFLPSDDEETRRRLIASIVAVPRHVLASSFIHHLVDYDATSAASVCRTPAAYIGAEAEMADLARIRTLIPALKIGRTLGSGHFSPVLVADQVTAMIRGFERTISDAS